MANAWKHDANYASMHIIRGLFYCYVFMNGRKLCPDEVCELTRVCELWTAKLSRLYCIIQNKLKLIIVSKCEINLLKMFK